MAKQKEAVLTKQVQIEGLEEKTTGCDEAVVDKEKESQRQLSDDEMVDILESLL